MRKYRGEGATRSPSQASGGESHDLSTTVRYENQSRGYEFFLKQCESSRKRVVEIRVVGLLNPTRRNVQRKFTTSTTYPLLSGNVGLFVRFTSIISVHLDRTARFIKKYCAVALPSRIGRRLRNATIQPLPISPLCSPFLREILQVLLSNERQVNACELPIPPSASWPSRGSVADVMPYS